MPVYVSAKVLPGTQSKYCLEYQCQNLGPVGRTEDTDAAVITYRAGSLPPPTLHHSQNPDRTNLHIRAGILLFCAHRAYFI